MINVAATTHQYSSNQRILHQRKQIQNADLIKFDKLCSILIDEEIFNKPDPMSAFTNTLIKIAKQTIPKYSPPKKKNPGSQ